VRESGRQVECPYRVAGTASALSAGSDIPKPAYYNLRRYAKETGHKTCKDHMEDMLDSDLVADGVYAKGAAAGMVRTDGCCSPRQHTHFEFNFASSMASYDVASTIYQSLEHGGGYCKLSFLPGGRHSAGPKEEAAGVPQQQVLRLR